MSRASPEMKGFAQRLIAFETKEDKSSGSKSPAAFRVCEKMRPQLESLLGGLGFQALLARALVLANTEVTGLRSFQVMANGSLAGPLESEALLEKISADGRVLVAQLLGLLVAFIGENLTLRLVSEVWPKLPARELYFREGNQK